MMLRISSSMKAIKDNAITSAKPCVGLGQCFIRRGIRTGKLEANHEENNIN